MAPGLVIAAPASGSGKTVVTLALLRHFRNAGRRVTSIKVGPDYIDPAFHSVASGYPCYNLDSWAMGPAMLSHSLVSAEEDADLVIAEGVMGLFDGAPGGAGSTAEIAALTGWPVILVVDVRGMAASAAALIAGFRDHSSDVEIAGVIFNRVGGASHLQLLEEACQPLGIPLLGGLRRDTSLILPDRHLGLVQASEHPDLEGFLENAAERLAAEIDVARLSALAQTRKHTQVSAGGGLLAPPGQRIAIASDIAFAFSYPAIIEGWRQAGAEVTLFSPLADEAPAADAEAVYLPGGYPELHAGRLAGNEIFMDGLRRAAERGAALYGECGGYMVLGKCLEDAEGRRHAMADLLPLESSFKAPKLSLGYRQVSLINDGLLGDGGAAFRGHEFHYAQILSEGPGEALFAAKTARGENLGSLGLKAGSVCGSFVHLIDRAN